MIRTLSILAVAAGIVVAGRPASATVPPPARVDHFRCLATIARKNAGVMNCRARCESLARSSLHDRCEASCLRRYIVSVARLPCAREASTTPPAGLLICNGGISTCDSPVRGCSDDVGSCDGDCSEGYVPGGNQICGCLLEDGSSGSCGPDGGDQTAASLTIAPGACCFTIANRGDATSSATTALITNCVGRTGSVWVPPLAPGQQTACLSANTADLLCARGNSVRIQGAEAAVGSSQTAFNCLPVAHTAGSQ